jgi:hypothetical protein
MMAGPTNSRKTIAMFLPFFYIASIAVSAPPPTVEEVAEIIHSNEERYQNIDVRYSRSVAALTGSEPHDTERVTRLLDSVRLVRQEALFFLSRDYNADSKAASESHEMRYGYDGARTVSIYPGYVNTSPERTPPKDMLLPHMWLMHDWGIEGTLSEWILRGFMNDPAYPDSWDVVGYESIDGVECLKLNIASRSSAEVSSEPVLSAALWLGINRNYLPVRFEAWRHAFSSEIPVSVGVSSGFRELESGIWLPFLCQTTDYDETAAMEERRIKKQVKTLEVKECSLRPNHPNEFFTLEVPKGMVVYELENVEVANSFIQGGDASRPRGFGTWLLYVNLVIFASWAAIFLKRRMQSHRSGSAT